MSNVNNIFGISGWKNSGKTTLTAALIKDIAARGYSVSSIKHAHHAFDIDHEGTDSFKHRAAGAQEVLISSSQRYALMHEISSNEEEPDLLQLLSKMSSVDVVLLEGFKSSDIPKIQVMRAESLANKGVQPVNNVVAYATDIQDWQSEDGLPTFDLNDVSTIADFALNYLKLS